MAVENENTEFKSQFTDDLYREVVAFANAEGGTIYIGVDDFGNVSGLKDVDDAYTRVTNGIRDAIAPDVTMFVKYELLKNTVIRITVNEGSYKPYYLKSRGLKPSGVYIRQGASSVQASPDQIRRMIRDSDGEVFENMRSMDQDLTFVEAEAAFLRYKTDFGKDKCAALGLCDLHNGLYTNLARLLADQCRHTIKAALFGDEDNTSFKDAKEFSGSLFRQLDDAFAYLSLVNHTAAEFRGLERIERPDYPEGAVREALLNAIVHRDYSYSGSTIVNVNDYCMEFISLGGLLSGLSAEDIRSGISQPRNPKLAEVFHRLRLIEFYGTGIRKIYSLYRGCSEQPQIEITNNTFKMVLPNKNKVSPKATAQQPGALREKPAPQMQIVLDYIAKHGEISEEELQILLNIKRTRTYTLTRQMRERGLIFVEGRGENKRYKMTNLKHI